MGSERVTYRRVERAISPLLFGKTRRVWTSFGLQERLSFPLGRQDEVVSVDNLLGCVEIIDEVGGGAFVARHDPNNTFFEPVRDVAKEADLKELRRLLAYWQISEQKAASHYRVPSDDCCLFLLSLISQEKGIVSFIRANLGGSGETSMEQECMAMYALHMLQPDIYTFLVEPGFTDEPLTSYQMGVST